MYPALPFYILSAAGILAAAVTVALPETANEKLANTLDEGEQFGRGQSFFLVPFVERRRRREKMLSCAFGGLGGAGMANTCIVQTVSDKTDIG